MALTKVGFTGATNAAYITSQSLSAGATLDGTAFDGAYGFSVLVQVTNGSTGPSAGARVTLQGSADGATWIPLDPRTAGLTDSVTYPFEFVRGVAGAGGDWPQYRIEVIGGTAQSVTVRADGCKTTAL